MDDLLANLDGRMTQNDSLSRFTSARLGGNADWVYIAKESVEELIRVIQTAWARGVPVRVLGGGANVLISDTGFRGLVIINRLSEITRGDWHDGRNLAVQSGTGLGVLARKCQSWGLSGLEWAVSVPGTVGGAIVNNAGAHGGDMAQNIADVVVLEPNGVKLYTREDLGYEYRHSALKSRADKRFLVLLATLILHEDAPEQIQARMDSFIEHRKRTQPQGASLGSIFKNPPNDYAGRLIEQAGLKGYHIGGAQVSPIHANFFLNRDGNVGSASDYYALIRHVQAEVESKFGVHLEPEIELLGEF